MTVNVTVFEDLGVAVLRLVVDNEIVDSVLAVIPPGVPPIRVIYDRTKEFGCKVRISYR